MTPIGVQKKTGNVTMGTIQTKSVPCGKCPPCRKRRISHWAFRLQQELKRSVSSHFVTLTYGTSTIPFTENGHQSVSVRDIQLFFKRLRKLHTTKIRYYACGEYGTETKRPHYHVILFNAEQDKIQQAWIHGSVNYGTVTGASIAYSLKYLSKPSQIPAFESDDRVREFALISKGLGENYLTNQMVAWHHADQYKRNYCNLLDGEVISMPRYYKQKIYTDKLHTKVLEIKARQKSILQENKLRAKNLNYSEDKFKSDLHQIKQHSKPSQNSKL